MQDIYEENVVQFDRSFKVEYRVKPYTKWFAAGQSFVTYGLEAFSGDQTVFSIPEVSVDYEKVKKFVALCNSCNASLEHIDDLIHDYFYVG